MTDSSSINSHFVDAPDEIISSEIGKSCSSKRFTERVAFCPNRVGLGLSAAYETIGDDLKKVESLILNGICGEENQFVKEVTNYGFKLGGKRLRPALLLLSGKVFGPLNENHIRCAAVLEMIHTATLIHDDILDGAEFRRHLETLNVHWNSGVSVLAGDVLFTKAMGLVTLSDDIFEYRAVADASQKTCLAELLQTGSKGHFQLSKAEYYSIISGKTAALLSCCCLLGAHLSGADDETKNNFGRFGENLGVAFQIVDDILDIVGDENVVGKTLGTDLKEGKITLPLILYLESATEVEKTKILDILKKPTPEQVCTVSELLKKSGAADAAKVIAEQKITAAIGFLEQAVSGTHDENAVNGLRDIANFVVKRKK
ncbi:MAG: polyprenyl synthetase family protein [Thermoguttaceae bacterium]